MSFVSRQTMLCHKDFINILFTTFVCVNNFKSQIVNLSLFQDGTFKLTLEFSEEYPNKPPVVKFLSKMFHPNIYADGGICLDILQNRWSPTYDVSAILTSIQSLVNI